MNDPRSVPTATSSPSLTLIPAEVQDPLLETCPVDPFYCSPGVPRGRVASRQPTPFIHPRIDIFRGNYCAYGVLPTMVSFGLLLFFFAVAHIRYVHFCRSNPNQAKAFALTNAPVWMKICHRWFFEPFIPASITRYALFLFVFAFGITAPMGWVRAVEKNQFAGALHGLQLLPNAIAESIATNVCNCTESVSLPYHYFCYPWEEPEHPTCHELESPAYAKGIDAVFWSHLIWGIAWVLVASLQ